PLGAQPAALGLTVPRIAREEGRRLFGSDPAAYDSARPGHAERVYEVLVERCGLTRGASVVEVGPGTGQATRRLLDLGADRVVAIEPDPALAAYLDRSCGGRVDVRIVALEDADLPAARFDLAVAASSFHWVEEANGLAKIFAAIRPGGWIALWWTLFGEGGEPDAFMQSVDPLLVDLHASPTHGEEGRPPHALDSAARIAGLSAAGFEDASHELVSWRTSWDTQRIRALYGTFSPIARLDDEHRTEILDQIARIAEGEFAGRVERAILTSLFTARRPGPLH
ncbi:MAG: class I SAM-dependent methyltransferase, partial [Gaiellaceae bacterium]